MLTPDILVWSLIVFTVSLAFAGIALVLWSRSRPFAAGLLLGLAIALATQVPHRVLPLLHAAAGSAPGA